MNDHETRQIRLEERLAFCERMNETLNEVVCDLQTRLTRTELRCELLAREVQRLQAIPREGEQRTLEDDRPPHY